MDEENRIIYNYNSEFFEDSFLKFTFFSFLWFKTIKQFVMKRLLVTISFIITAILFFSCTYIKKEDEITRLISEWSRREILFPKEIYFTSGGSEADNQAIRSAALFGAKKGKKHLISTKIEHHAVLIIHTYNYLHLSFSPFFYLLYASCFPRNQSKRQLLHPGPQIGTPDCQRVDNHRSYTHWNRFSFFHQPAHIVYDIKIAILISQIHHHMSRKI